MEARRSEVGDDVLPAIHSRFFMFNCWSSVPTIGEWALAVAANASLRLDQTSK
jgi:hypothetical protein